MGFDPDAYIAEKKAEFDPDAYLGTTKPLPLTPEKKAKIKRTTDAGMVQPRSNSFLDALAEAAKERGREATTFLQEANDTFTMGLWPKITDAIGVTSREGRAKAVEESPNAAAMGTGTGLAASGLVGPGALAGKAAVAASKEVAGAAPRVVSQLAKAPGARVVGQAATAGTAAAGQEALDAAARGTDISDAAERGFSLGSVFGGASKLVGDTATGLRKLVGGDPWIARYLRSKESGVYDAPEMKALEKGERGMEQAAKQGFDRIVAKDQKLAKEAGGRYKAKVEPNLPKPYDKKPVLDELEAGRRSHLDPDTGMPLRDSVDKRFRAEIAKVQGPPPPAPPEQSSNGARFIDDVPDAPPAPPEKATVEGLLAKRRALREDSGFGSPAPTPEQEAAREAYQTYRQAVRKASPEVATADDEYAGFATKRDRRRDILFNTEDDVIGAGKDLPDAPPIEHADDLALGKPQSLADELPPAEPGNPQICVGKEKSAVTTLKRVGDTNEPGLRAERYLKELAEQDPEFAAALEFIANKKAFEGTRFGLRSKLPTNLTGAARLGGIGPLLEQNSRAIGARLVDPTARFGEEAAEVLTGAGQPAFLMMLSDAARRKREGR